MGGWVEGECGEPSSELRLEKKRDAAVHTLALYHLRTKGKEEVGGRIGRWLNKPPI